ncbi:hypothetical protein TIFTF001_039701 [Ficus carica]|uniref:Uncharacterized protein n=1 Tax=Ficus carica TaxID=3494 RepID=A0AA88E9M3_FICCA|nr:hypothetical protein TIFTF001_039701 [Ficus carica]
MEIFRDVSQWGRRRRVKMPPGPPSRGGRWGARVGYGGSTNRGGGPIVDGVGVRWFYRLGGVGGGAPHLDLGGTNERGVRLLEIAQWEGSSSPAHGRVHRAGGKWWAEWVWLRGGREGLSLALGGGNGSPDQGSSLALGDWVERC